MTREDALQHVQRALELDNYTIRDHFDSRLGERLMFWPDVLGVIETPSRIETDGTDKYGRERWFFKGMTTANAEIEVFTVFENDDTDSVIFWTIYWDQNGRRKTDKD